MQKLKLFIVFLLIAAFVPLAANAESSTPSGVTVKSIKRANDSGNAKELYPATADGQTINLGIKLSNPGDFAKYTLTLNNASDKDFSLDEKSLNHSTDYMSYEFANNAESNVIKAGKDATITLKALYQNQVPTNKYTNNIFSDTNELILNLNPISETPQNPITSDNILIYLSTFLILVAFAYLAFKKKKYSIFILIAIGVIANVTPISVHALHTNSITATVTIRIEQPQDAIIPPNENKEAYFLTGSQVNAKMKRLAGTNIGNEEEPSVNETVSAIDSNIVAILHSKNEPTSANKEAKNTVSTKESPLPIYMWYNNGAIYWWSEDETPNLHQNSEDMFRGASSLTSLDGLKDWNASSVTDMSSMFEDAKSLTSIEALRNWDTSNVTDIHIMFRGASSLTSLDGLKDWNTSKVTRMSAMFNGAKSLTSIDGLENWDTSKVTNMSSIFEDAESLTSIDALRKWATSNVTDMSLMFSGTKSLTSTNGLENWNTSNVTDMRWMFSSAESLTSLDGLKDWNTSNVTDMDLMFKDAKSLTSVDALRNWNTSNVTDMHTMFSGAKSLTSINGLENWNTSKVTNMSYMFEGASSLTSLDGLEDWDTSKVTDMSYMFSSDRSLSDTSAINDWDIRNVASGKFEHMFWDAPTHPNFTKVQGTWSDDGTFIPNQN